MTSEAGKRGIAATIYAMILAVIGLILLGGGGYLITLCGSPYFGLAGLAVLGVTWLVWRSDRRAAAAYGLFLLVY